MIVGERTQVSNECSPVIILQRSHADGSRVWQVFNRSVATVSTASRSGHSVKLGLRFFPQLATLSVTLPVTLYLGRWKGHPRQHRSELAPYRYSSLLRGRIQNACGPLASRELG
jgi:hypothetical protein